MTFGSVLRILFKGNGTKTVREAAEIVTEGATKVLKQVREIIHHTRRQSYYDDFGRLMDEGIACFNPRTGNTTLCKGDTLVVRQGKASLETTFKPWGSICDYADSSTSSYLTEVNFYPGNKALVRKRTVEKSGIYDSRFPYSSPFLNSYNSASI